MNRKKKFIVMFEGKEVMLYREDIANALTELMKGEMLMIIN
jgi:hypothetical protein